MDVLKMYFLKRKDKKEYSIAMLAYQRVTILLLHTFVQQTCQCDSNFKLDTWQALHAKKMRVGK